MIYKYKSESCSGSICCGRYDRRSRQDADTIASHIEIKLEDKQSLLETIDAKKRLEKLNSILLKEIEILNIEQDISSKSNLR